MLTYIDAILLFCHSTSVLSTHSILPVLRSLYLYYVMYVVIYRLPNYIWPKDRIFNIRTKCISNLLENISNALYSIYNLITQNTLRTMRDMNNLQTEKLFVCELYIQRYTSSHISNIERTTRKMSAHIQQYRFICRDEHEADLTHPKLLGTHTKGACK
jgi:hypothetical protein